VITAQKDAPSPPPARTYLTFDGPIRFPQGRYVDSKMVPFGNFQVGDELWFDYYLNAVGPNPIETGGGARALYLEPDSTFETQQAMFTDFAARLKKERKEHPVKEVIKTVMPGPAGWDSVLGHDKNGKAFALTANDLDALQKGTQVAFVIVELKYRDRGKLHHLRTCQFLQPPAIPPGLWYFCDGFTKSD
jgi:hypothetical protein